MSISAFEEAAMLIPEGVPVFPLKQDKRPYTTHGHKDATTDAAQIEAWGRRWPDAMVGVPTGVASGIFVLDVDVKSGKDGFKTMREKGWTLPPTRSHRTRNGGGAHYLFRLPQGVTLRSSASKLGDGLDTRGEGGYIVWWPAHGGEVENPDLIADIPDFILDALAERADGKSSPAISVEGDTIPEGSRNDRLFRLAAALRHKGLSADAIEAALMAENMEKCIPPLPDDEVKSIAKSAGRYPAGTLEIGGDISRLADLPPLDYDRVREAEAERLGVRVGTLDKEVSRVRRENQDARGKTGMFPEVMPWPDPVDGVELLDEILATIHRHIICMRETAISAALWIVLTWIIDHVQVAPLAVITAPEKRCGKTQLLSLIGRLCRRGLVASNISPAATFRVIEAHSPTLLIDEADSFFKDNEELRGVINSGHTRQSAYVIRTVGDDHEPCQFSTWGAKAISGIGHLSETLMDRAIILELRRKLPGEEVQRLRHVDPDHFERLASMLARFAEDAGATIGMARPDLPEALNDRAQDNWEPLLAIADHVGGDWPELARQAALKISGHEQGTLSLSAELLADIREIFDTKGIDRITTADMLDALTDNDEAPWRTYYRGNPINARQLGKRLKEYGISSKDLKLSPGYVRKGFDRAQFEDAFRRYLTPSQDTPEKCRDSATFCDNPSVHAGREVADKSDGSATDDRPATSESAQMLEGSGVAANASEAGRVSIPNKAAQKIIDLLRDHKNGKIELCPSRIESGELLLRCWGFSPERIQFEVNKSDAARLLDLVREYQRLKGSISVPA